MTKMKLTVIVMLLMFNNACSKRPKESTLAATSEAVALSQYNTETQSLYAFLKNSVQKKQFIFGQQRASLVGVGENGDKAWTDGGYGSRTDVEYYVGQKVGMIGIDIWDLATKNPTWNQPVYAQAIRDFYDSGKGGAITLDWHMRGCSVKPVSDINGNSGIPGDGFKVNDWEDDPNADCLCKIVNEQPWENGLTWKDWFLSQKLDKFYQILVKEQLTEVPLIYRPFHEQTGNWFWWGAKGWNCQRQLGKNDVVTGAEAYKKLFRMTVDYLRQTKGLKNLLIAFAPDKLCKHDGHTCSFTNAIKDAPTDDELKNDYLNSYPGDEYVDILGIDLYYAQKFGNAWEEADYQTKLFKQHLRVMSKIADEKSKVAALTETGNYNLHNEVSAGSQWFTKQLLSMLTDPEVNISYVLTWENRRLAATEYYIPHKKHADFQDFVDFSDNAATLFYNDLTDMYKPALTETAGDIKPVNPTQNKVYPSCQTRDSDPDGDGWGWENNQSCRVRMESHAACSQLNADPDGDGWGWENGQSCKSRAEGFATCTQLSVDPDGDGWGFENGATCRVRLESYPKCTQGTGGRGDGWGYENGRSCRQ